MKYLLDTNIVINHLRGKTIVNKKIISEGACLSIISYGELIYGAYKSKYKEKNLNQIQIFIDKLSVEVININKAIIKIYAELKSSLEIKGQKLDNFDLLIGATARVYSLTLKTENIKHFQRIPGLKLN